jgi:hypothetical protein
MEFVVITLLLIVVILQIVILANQKKNAKLVRDLATFKPKSQQPEQNRDRFRDRKDNNFRNNRRNQQDFRTKQPPAATQPAVPPSGAVDSVEKSLRDINLKLKNAERDQETARRKIQENIGRDQPRQRQQSEGNRAGRDRDHKRDRGDRNRDSRRGDRNNRNNWRSRNNHERVGDGNEQSSSEPVNHPAIKTAAIQEPQQPVMSMEPTAALPDLNPVDFDGEMEHGRKVQVKRRMLKEDLPGSVPENQTDAATEESVSGNAGNFNGSDSVEQSESSTDEISFGRR